MPTFMSFKLPDIAEAVRNFGYKGKEYIDDDYSFIESATSGRNFFLYCYSSSGKSLKKTDGEAQLVRFRGAWNIENYNESEVDALCNWFNSGQEFSKLFRQSSNDYSHLIIEADLFVLDGMSMPAFENRMAMFISQFEYAMKCLHGCRVINKANILDRHNKAVEILHGGMGDSDEAVKLYKHNSYLGFAGSQNNLGDLFEIGELVPQDNLLAVYWYTRSSERGEPTAYLSLASILSKNIENTDALIIAAKYAALAIEKLPEGKNKLSAEEVINSLKQILHPDSFKFAIQLAENFKPIYEEKWTLTDSPSPKTMIAPGSELIN